MRTSKAAGQYETKAQVVTGKGEFIGTKLDSGSDREQRDDALRVYQRVIEEAEDASELRGRDMAGLWNDIRNHWPALSTTNKGPIGRGYPDYDPNQPRDDHGRWGAGGGTSTGTEISAPKQPHEPKPRVAACHGSR